MIYSSSIKKLVLVLLSLMVLSCSSARIAQELHQGKSNFEAGDYKVAFRQLLPLANEGNKEAQYAVGYMYYYGYGVSLDTESGIFWIKKAADQHYRAAMIALETMDKK